jgi:regulator of sirC expression with transglutaminase-like and TPR domain
MQGEVSALISLIDDPDEEIFAQVKQELCRYGESLIPQLKHHCQENQYGTLFNSRVEHLIQELQYHAIYNRLKEWKSSESHDLLEGMLILNRYQYPQLDELALRRIVLKIKQDIWLELNDLLTAFEVVNVFNTILFKVHHFQGSVGGVNGHCSLSDLLETKRGESIIIGTVYSYLAESLDISLPMINVPGFCILAYRDMGFDLEDETLFYLNPHDGGAIISREEIVQSLIDLKYPVDESFFTICSKMEWMGRMINALLNQAIAVKDNVKVSELRTLQSLLLENH